MEETSAFVSSLQYFALGESLGGVRALVCLPCKMTHASIPAEERHALGLSDTLVRLSPGCESPRDLVRDIVSGLDRLGSGTSASSRCPTPVCEEAAVS
jgi:cystathionine beta-lyase/cystathionine gamma-synthase